MKHTIRRKLLSALLVACMAFTMVPAAFAEEASTESNESTETVTASALPEADANGVITLNENVTIGEVVSIQNANTIDLNGYTLSVTRLDSYTDLTIRDTSNDKKGVLTSSGSNTCVVWGGHSITLESGTITNTNEAGTTIFNLGTFTMDGGAVSGDTVIYNTAKNGNNLIEGNIVCNINNGKVEAGTWGIVALGAGLDENGNANNDKVTVNITGGEIAGTGDCQAIATNASGGVYAGFTINISGGTIDGGDAGCGMYLPAIGVTNISGGLVRGAQAIRIAAGELNITGGTVEGTSALTENTDLISGGSGGTEGAIVVGKAGDSGYVGDIVVNVSQNAVIQNSVDNGAAVVVSDKNMSNDNYTNYSIDVSMENVSVTGNIVKASNITQGNQTSDGGNTNLEITGCSVTGNVINNSKTPLSLDNTTVTGNASNGAEGSLLITNSIVRGAVSSTSSGPVAVVSSQVESTTGTNITLVSSTVGGQTVEDTADGNIEAFVNGTPYATLEEAIENVQDGDVVTLLKDVTVNASGKVDTQGILTITKDITFNGNGKTITAESVGSNATPSMINIQDNANVTFNNVILDGAINGTNTVKHGFNIYQGAATLNNVTVNNHTGYAAVVNGSTLNVNGFTTANNGWGGINVEGKAGNANLIVNNATITEDNSIKFEQTPPDSGSVGSVSATIYNGTFRYLTAGSNAQVRMTINGGTFASGSYPGMLDIEDYLADGLEFDPVTGQVSRIPEEPPYTGDYNYPVTIGKTEHGTVTIAKEDQWANDGEKITVTVTPDDAYMLDELVIKDKAGNELQVKDNGDGTYTFTMPEGAVTITATFVEDPDWVEPEPEPEPSTDVTDIFSDVTPGAWYVDVVQYAYDHGLMTGTSATTFEPDTTTSRAMIVSILHRLEGSPSVGTSDFSDVASGVWYADPVAWAAENGIVAGFEDGTFGPNDPITREQMASILYRYAEYKGIDTSARADLSAYSDQPSAWAQDVMEWANAEGLINGTTATTLDPQGTATRAQVAAMLQRFIENVL